jgi:hypothetical protein
MLDRCSSDCLRSANLFLDNSLTAFNNTINHDISSNINQPKGKKRSAESTASDQCKGAQADSKRTR